MEVRMVTVKCILGYFDTKLNRRVAIGEEIEVDEARANQLVKAKVGEVTTTTPKEVAKPQKTRKKKEA